MQVQNLDWQEACLAQWDQECQISNGDYCKMNFSLCETTSSISSNEKLDEITHEVTPWDSLEGLSLLYNVSISSIKQRNGLYSNDIYYLEKLVIPQATENVGQTLQEEKDEKVTQFLIRAKLSLKQEKIAIKALEETFWKLENALIKHRKDQEWEAKYSKFLEGPNFRKRYSEGLLRRDFITI